VDSPSSLHIQNFHGVISVNGSEYPATPVVYRHVVKSALDAGHWDDPYQDQWRELVI